MLDLAGTDDGKNLVALLQQPTECHLARAFAQFLSNLDDLSHHGFRGWIDPPLLGNERTGRVMLRILKLPGQNTSGQWTPG